MRRPVLLFPKRHSGLGLAPTPFPSGPAPPPWALGEERRVVEQRPSPPPSRPLAMAEGRKKQGWEEAHGERLRGAVPPAPLLIRGGVRARPPLSANPAH